MNAPFLSIVVLSKNPGPRIAIALESIWSQSTAADIVVVDGGSTDGTVEWLRARADRLTTLIVEPDQGVYDAMNKGIAAARTEWILFMGADDRLIQTSTVNEVQSWLRNTGANVVTGEVVYDDGRVYKLGQRVNPLARNFVHHQGTFYRRTVFGSENQFDRTLKIMGDYDLNLRLWKQGGRFKPIPLRIAECRSNGLSDCGKWLVYREEITVRHRYAQGMRCWIWDALSVVRFVRKNTLVAFRRRHG